MTIHRLVALACGLALATGVQAASLAYPPAAPGPIVEDYHGTPVADPYRWLEDLDSPATRAWVDAERRLSDAYLAARPGRRAIRNRLVELYGYEVIGTPFRAGGRLFYTRGGGRLGQAQLLMRAGRDGEAVVALDPNSLSADNRLAVAGFVPSPDGHRLAYGVSVSGSDWTEWRVRDLDSGRDLPDVLRNTKYYRPVFARDGHGLYYSAFPAPPAGEELTTPDRDNAIWYHALGTPADADVRVLVMPGHPDWQYEPSISDDGRWLIVTAGEGEVGDKNLENVYALDLAHPGHAPVTLADGFAAAYLYVGSAGGRVFMLTSESAPRGRIVAIDPSGAAAGAWQEVIGEGADAIAFKAGNVVHARGHFVVETMHDAANHVTTYREDGTKVGDFALPGEGTVSGLEARGEDDDVYYTYSSLIAPPTVYRYAFADRTARLFSAPSVAFDGSAFEQRQVFYAGKDGTRIPMLLACRKGLRLDGRNPVLLFGYGGFASPELPAFSESRIPWLEMGGVYAIANIRGGGEYGEAWHRAGTLERKQNVFDDFAAAAQWLVAQHYTTRDRLGIYGRSNGGLLVGASITQHPELFGAAVAGVGVLDMLRFDRFGQGAGWTGDYGSPRDPAQFQALYAYSPVHRVKKGTQYPPTLIITGDHDTRVHPMHSFKFAAAMQAAQSGPAPVLLVLENSSGHSGGRTQSQAVEQSADLYAFLADALKVRSRPR